MRRTSPAAPLAAGLLAAGLLAGGLAAAPAAAAELAIPHEAYQLPNGLQVILHPDPSLPQVVVNIWYEVGAKDEVVGRTGFAHLFEHLMFMGTERLPGSGFDDLMEARGGWNNAWTSEDATDYYDVGPAELLDTLLWMEADRMDGLDRAMTRKKVDKQRDVVQNERRQSYEDSPYGVAWLAMPEVMYPPGHPYAHTVIGSHEDLRAADLDDVIGFFRTWYVPRNASLVVAGDFDPARVKPLIAEWFGALEDRPVPERAAPPPVPRPMRALTELTDDVELARGWMLWHSAPALQPGDAELDVLAAILSDGPASRLYQNLVAGQAVATEAEAYQMSARLGSIFIVELAPAEGQTLDAVEAAAQAELARLAAEGPTDEELRRVLNGLEHDFLRGLEDLQTRASMLNRYRSLTGDPGFIAQDLARYRAVDAAAVRRAAAALTADARALIRVNPQAPEAR